MFRITRALADAAAYSGSTARAAGPQSGSAAQRSTGFAALALLASLASAPARAADGCTILLCLAAPSWRAIAQCVPPIRQLLRDLARGRAFPTCGMGGSGNSSDHTWSHPPNHCPPQYVQVTYGPNGQPFLRCDYMGVVSVTVNGALFTRTWWNLAGDAVTEFSDTAKRQLGQYDTRFDDEYAAWLLNGPHLPIGPQP
jgi:hypothetical protein